MDTQDFISKIKPLIMGGYYASKKALEIIDSSDDKTTPLAIYKLNQSIYYMSSAKALYLSQVKQTRYELDDIFSTYELYLEEFTNSVITNHNHGHTNSYFNTFAEAVDFIKNTIASYELDNNF